MRHALLFLRNVMYPLRKIIQSFRSMEVVSILHIAIQNNLSLFLYGRKKDPATDHGDHLEKRRFSPGMRIAGTN